MLRAEKLLDKSGNKIYLTDRILKTYDFIYEFLNITEYQVFI